MGENESQGVTGRVDAVVMSRTYVSVWIQGKIWTVRVKFRLIGLLRRSTRFALKNLHPKHRNAVVMPVDMVEQAIM